MQAFLSSPATPFLSIGHTFLVVIATALLVYVIFKRYEPSQVSAHVCFLVVLPAILVAPFLRHLTLLRALFVCFSAYFGTLALCTVSYRLSPLHPLAQYPGPASHKVSKLWMAILALHGRQHLHIHDLHERFGDIVRIGPNELSIRDASAIAPLMGSNGLPKGPSWTGRSMKPAILSLMSLRNPHEHARRRKPWIRAFNPAALKEYEELIAKRATQLIERLVEQRSETDLGTWFNYFAFDFMMDMAFGGGVSMLCDGDVVNVWHNLEKGLVWSLFLGHVPWLAPYFKNIPGLCENLKAMRKFSGGRAVIRVKNGSLTRDLFYYLNNEDGAEEVSPPLAQVVAEGQLAVLAGSDTTASVLTSMFWCLLSHPAAYKRLQAEVDAYYPPGENALDTKHHADMPYLNAVINEAMRLFPPAPSGSPRGSVKGTGSKFIGPYHIPEETNVSIHFHSVQRDPRNFSPMPNNYWPERWLIAAGDETIKLPMGEAFVHNMAAYVPFSFGPANCVGKNVAMQEMRMVVSLLMQELELRFPEGWDPAVYERGLKDHHVYLTPRLPVLIERRQKVSL
ncbi:hypothetical protein AcW1_000956 [Taiwanofungus camphoratus]|nr:hypothetical protein AcW1_000956 [Antrodia cinnamomea]